MSASDLILAAALLSAPAGTPEPTPAEANWPSVRDAIHKVAVEWEIMDERESRYVLAGRDDFQADLDLLRRRQAELADAPKLAECRRLPDRQTVNEFLRFNRAFRKTLEDRAVWELDRADLLHNAMQEADRLYRQWDAVRDAQCDFYYVTVRRAALKKLREAIGPDSFATGHMPPYVPDWRFAAAAK
jgi:hypothetical protein